MKIKNFFLIMLLLSVNVFTQTKADFSIEGHRGARGYVPENTIASFIKAFELGADTVELDVVISKDQQVVVSHDFWFSSAISLDKNGNSILADRQKEFNLYRMDYAEIKLYDVGSLGSRDFPHQVKMKAYKPLLSEVFKEINLFARKNNLKRFRVNVEIKSDVLSDNIYHPPPPVFAKLVYDEILKSKMQKHVIVQSFDVRPLQQISKMPVKLPLALLIGNKDGIEKNLERLGFLPDTYSPHYSSVDEKTVEYCHQRSMKIIPWTVNEPAEFEKMKKFRLDGVITDYPDRAIKIYRR